MRSGRREQARRSRPRRSEPLLEKGLTTSVIGVVMLAAPLFVNGSPVLNAVAQGVRIPALLAVGIGAVLLAVHALTRKPAERAASIQAPALDEQPPALASWSDDVLSMIEWRRFEALVEALFAQAGFETRSQSHGSDGGVDIWLHSKNAEGAVAVVQCKHWQGKPVGVREMREFLGVMASHGLKRGTYATSSSFTNDALAFAKANGINAQDGGSLLRMIRRRTPEQQAELLAVATEGEYWRPTCASCGVKMVERSPRSGGSSFWGCVNFPQCRATLPKRPCPAPTTTST